MTLFYPVPSDLIGLSRRTRPLTRWLKAAFRRGLNFLAVLRLWSMRRRTRRQLFDLDDHMLRDIGVSRDDARREARLPFWLP